MKQNNQQNKQQKELKKKHKKERIEQNIRYENSIKMNGIPGNKFIVKNEARGIVEESVADVCRACKVYLSECAGNNDYCDIYMNAEGYNACLNCSLRAMGDCTELKAECQLYNENTFEIDVFEIDAKKELKEAKKQVKRQKKIW